MLIRKLYVVISAGLIAGLMVSLVEAMGRIPKKEYQTKVEALEKCVNRTDTLESELEAIKSRVSTLESQNAELLKDMEASRSQLQRKLADLLKEKQEVERAKEEEVSRLKSTYDQLVGDMKKEIEEGTVKITQLRDQLSVNLVEKVLFHSGEAEVNPQGRKILKRVAEILKKVQDKQIRIEGHTDNVPLGVKLRKLFPTNWELSATRATNVTRYLVEEGRIDPKVIFAAGFGEYHPIAENDTVEGRARNRRIEIVLVPLTLDSAAGAEQR